MSSFLKSPIIFPFETTIKISDHIVRGSITFNPVNQIQVPFYCGDGFPNTQAFLQTPDKTCFNLISSDRKNNIYTMNFVTKTEDLNAKGFSINSKNHNFSIDFVCDESEKTKTYKFGLNSVSVISAHCCGKRDLISQFFSIDAIQAISLFCFGLFLTFFGGNRFKSLICFYGLFLGFSFVIFMFYAFTDISNSHAQLACIIATGLIIGLFVGWLTFQSSIFSSIVIIVPTRFVVSKLLVMFMKQTLKNVQ